MTRLQLQQPVLAYRSWIVRPDAPGRPRLHATNTRHEWEPGINVASCRARAAMRAPCPRCGRKADYLPALDYHHCKHCHYTGTIYLSHEAPVERCECGLYAMRALLLAEARAWRIGFARAVIVGAVVMWGELQVHAAGLRAEFAQIVALSRQQPLAERQHTQRLLDELGGHYDVPTVDRDRLAAHGYDWGAVHLPEWQGPTRASLAAYEQAAAVFQQMGVTCKEAVNALADAQIALERSTRSMRKKP